MTYADAGYQEISGGLCETCYPGSLSGQTGTYKLLVDETFSFYAAYYPGSLSGQTVTYKLLAYEPLSC